MEGAASSVGGEHRICCDFIASVTAVEAERMFGETELVFESLDDSIVETIRVLECTISLVSTRLTFTVSKVEMEVELPVRIPSGWFAAPKSSRTLVTVVVGAGTVVMENPSTFCNVGDTDTVLDAGLGSCSRGDG